MDRRRHCIDIVFVRAPSVALAAAKLVMDRDMLSEKLESDARHDNILTEMLARRPMWACSGYKKPVSGWLGSYCGECFWPEESHASEAEVDLDLSSHEAEKDHEAEAA